MEKENNHSIVFNINGNYIDKQVINNNYYGCQQPDHEHENSLPDLLASDEAMALWKKLQDADLIDASFQPTGSATECAYIAHWMAEKLNISNCWTLFGKLWGKNKDTLRRKFYQGLETDKISKCIDTLKDMERN